MGRILRVAIGLCLLLLVATAFPAGAKAPSRVAVYPYGSDRVIATIDTEDELLAFANALYSNPESLPASALPATWDYRLVTFWDPGLQYPTEYLYRTPDSREGGVVLMPGEGDAFFLIRSPSFDAFMAEYVPSAPPSESAAPYATWPGWIVPAVVAAVGAWACVGGRLALRRFRLRAA